MENKIIFWGTPEFAARILKHLLSSGIQISAVVTQPDKPSGRKQEITASAVKQLALGNKIAILQPEKLKDKNFLADLRKIGPALSIVAAYGKIIPQEALDIPQKGSINVHPSLLPKYRGASPVSSAIMSGDKETGVTLILMDAQMDHGAILAQEKHSISPTDTNETLHNQLADLSGKMLVKLIPQWLTGKVTPVAQDETKATFTKILSRDDGRVDFKSPAILIEWKIRALTPWPQAWTKISKCPGKTSLEGKKIIIHQARAIPDQSDVPPGTVKISGNKLIIFATDGALEVKEIQLEGRKAVPVSEFINGYSEINGCQLE